MNIEQKQKIVSDLLKQDEIPSPRGWIQWKGTEVCIDIHCPCGHLGHYDGYFFYFYECPKCKRVYSVGQNVSLYPLTDEQKEYAKPMIKTSEFYED